MRVIRATISYHGTVKTIDESGAKVGSKENRLGHRNAIARLADGSRVHLHDSSWRHTITPVGKHLFVPQLHPRKSGWITPFPRRGEVIYGILDDTPPKNGKHPELAGWCRDTSYERDLHIICAQQSYMCQEEIFDHVVELIEAPGLNMEIWKELMTELGCSEHFIAAVLAHYFVGMPASQVNRIFAPS